MSDLKPRQEQSLERAVKLRAGIDEAWRRFEIGVYKSVRVQNVPVRVVAERLDMTRSRIYQIVKKVELDK
jgi:hypothetical protein